MNLEDKIQEEDYFKNRSIAPEDYDNYKLPQYIINVLPKDVNAKILDIGCGLGQMLKCISERGYKDLTGVDINNESIKKCASLGLNVTKIDDILSFAASSKTKYDFIIMSHVLEHIEKNKMIENLKAIKECLLSENGKFCVMVPNAQSNTGSYWRFEDFTHHYIFTTGSLVYVLKAAGFTKIDFIDPEGMDDIPSYKRPAVKFFLKLYKLNKKFWNKITISSYYRPNPQIFTFELKALAS